MIRKIRDIVIDIHPIRELYFVSNRRLIVVLLNDISKEYIISRGGEELNEKELLELMNILDDE